MILSQVLPVDALHVAGTCRAAYPLALPFVLSDVKIGDFDPRDHPDRDPLTSFCAYMLSDIGQRAKLLRSLTILPNAFVFLPGSAPISRRVWEERRRFIDYSAAKLLALVVRLSPNLQVLKLPDAEPIFTAVPELGRAVAALTRLDYVSLGVTHRHTLRVLSLMQSRPRHVECHIAKSCDSDSDLEDDEEDEYGEDDEPKYDPLRPGEDHFGENFTSSLITLKVNGYAYAIMQLEPATSWTAVEQLELHNDGDLPMFNLDTLSRAFPNVRHLSLSHYMHLTSESYTSRLHDPAHWPNLDTVEVDGPLPLNRLVRYLRLQYTGVAGPFVSLLRQFLSASSPVILVCYAEVPVVECVATAAPSVKFLQLACSPRHYIPQDTLHALESVFPILARLRLRAVTYTAANPYRVHDESKTLIYAEYIARTIPSVEFVGLQRGPEWWPQDISGYHWFHVVLRPQEEPPVLERLTQREADALVLELLATQRD